MQHQKSVQEFICSVKKLAAESSDKLRYRNPQENTASLTSAKVEENTLWLTFSDGKVSQCLTIPVPQKDECGNAVIIKGSVSRAVGSWMVDGKELSFFQLMRWILTENISEYFQSFSKRSYIDRLVASFQYSISPIIFKGLQRIIDEVVNRLPLVNTSMQTWAMCSRIQILDPVWDSLTPEEKLSYQKKLNKDLFPYTSLGLSDSGMCNNDILKVDVRETVPFGLCHHNPRRNLYQTLGMKGDELPKTFSAAEKNLADKGIVRKGWNLMTAFVDMPINFEDQIIVSSRLKDLFITEEKTYTSFGSVVVIEGEQLNWLSPISIEPDGDIVKFALHADSACVKEIKKTHTNFNGQKTQVTSVVVEYKRLFKDGFKLTNRHGNKGIIILEDTGTAYDPVRGEVPIDVIVSARSVKKRKNFGQILEALTTLINGLDKDKTFKNSVVAHTDVVKESLKAHGYPEDGQVEICTQWGNFRAVCGWIHWGCIKTPEDQIWSKSDTRIMNNNDVRVAGNKISHIETKALTTIFGFENPVLDEIHSHWQGHDQVFEYLKVLQTLVGQKEKLPTIPWSQIKVLDQSGGFFHGKSELVSTVADIDSLPDRFYISLPEPWVYTVTKGMQPTESFCKKSEAPTDSDTTVLDKILVVDKKFRKPWKHQSGHFGLTDVASCINSILRAINRFDSGQDSESKIGRAIFLYFNLLSKSISTKNGSISNYCMSVRYPWTAKATASVRDYLFPNEIEIHTSMAKDLAVTNGDLVLVERFPCLGFMSMRVQKVRVTDDPQARFVIRVSGNSLASLALDFDGDVIYLMSFHSAEAKKALEKEFSSPHTDRVKSYDRSSNKKIPTFNELGLDDYKMEIFPKLTAEKNAEIVEGLTGIKRGTGTIIALCYNLMRIIEHEPRCQKEDIAIGLEVLLDKVANSVFSRKHAGKSLEKECRKAIYTADASQMVDLGFGQKASEILSSVLLQKAKEFGVCGHKELEKYFLDVEENGGSHIVNRIIRKYHKIWFTSRSNLHPTQVVFNLSRPPQDLASKMFHKAKKLYEGEINCQ